MVPGWGGVRAVLGNRGSREVVIEVVILVEVMFSPNRGGIPKGGEVSFVRVSFVVGERADEGGAVGFAVGFPSPLVAAPCGPGVSRVGGPP